MHVRTIALMSLLICASGFAAPVFAGQAIDVVDEGGIKDKWMLKEGVPLAVPAYPPAFVDRKDQVCVSVGYVVKPDGTTSDFTLLKAWNSASGDDEPVEGYWMAFASAAGDALSQWQFQPRPEVKKATPVFTAGTFVFGATGPDLRAHCRIANLSAHLRDLRDHAGRRAPRILSDLDLRDDALDSRTAPRVSIDM